jgi:hypothetical protein
MYCRTCGNEVNENAEICVHCGCRVAPAMSEDKVSIGFCILAFLIPLFGFIYWGVKAKETPKRARAVGITAIVSFVLNIILIATNSI